MSPLVARQRAYLHAFLIALDQLAYVMLAGPGSLPSPYETISSRCGRAANAGARWGLIAQRWIDHLFELLGSPPGHCQRSIVRADWLSAPLP